MPLDTEVISCPACRHLLRVPLDWLGQNVQCPECRALFKAPVRVGDVLGQPELISPSPSASLPPGTRKRDFMLLLPGFGILVCGVMGTIVNGSMLAKLLSDADGGRAWARDQVLAIHKFKEKPNQPENRQQDDADAEQLLRLYRWTVPLFLAVSLGELVGGLSMVLGWRYRLALMGCVLGMLNLPGFCCVPGSMAGLWGLIMLASQEGRSHFRRS